MIETTDLRKSYGPTRAVDGISFSIKRGEIVGLLGPNGAGKSTTIRMMTTYLAPDGGRVVIGGRDVEEQPIEVRRMLGYMPDSAPLYHNMRVLDYLDFIAQARDLGSQSTACIERAVSKCGLAGVLRKSISALSRGFRQRVSLAQAILHDPEILILDEPTTGLDPNQILEIRSLIRELGEEKTVILSTHILPEVSAVCHRAIIINRGRVVADGTLQDLQARASGGSVVVSYAAENDAFRQAVEGLDGVEGIAELERGNGGQRIRVSGPAADLGGAIFELAAQHGCRLTELAPERFSIEEVFHKLTGA